MKYSIVLFASLILTAEISGQQEKAEAKKFQIEIGYMYLMNSLNADNYYNFKYITAPETGETSMSGVSLKFTIPGKKKNIDFIAGTIFLIGNDDLGSKSWIPAGTNNSVDYRLNGGGVYFGISPNIHGKIIGLTSDFAVGAFSFKEYLGLFSNSSGNQVEVYDRKSSGGLGAMSSLGLSVRLGNMGIKPAINAVYSGGNEASFIFYGFVVPLTYQFCEFK